MKNISIDIETFSSVDLGKCGVYKYAESPDFEILLFGYSVDGGPVQVVDLASGEQIPCEILAALMDSKIQKWAFNAQFERICLSRYLSDLGVAIGTGNGYLGTGSQGKSKAHCGVAHRTHLPLWQRAQTLRGV